MERLPDTLLGSATHERGRESHNHREVKQLREVLHEHQTKRGQVREDRGKDEEEHFERLSLREGGHQAQWPREESEETGLFRDSLVLEEERRGGESGHLLEALGEEVA